jgi:hypothetical protein
MKKLIAIPAIALAAGLSLAACSSGAPSNSSSLPTSGPRTCWTTSTGVVTETVQAASVPLSDIPPCTAVAYVPATEGGPQTVSPAMPSGLGSPQCTVTFPATAADPGKFTWRVWATDSSANALMWCSQLESEPGASS